MLRVLEEDDCPDDRAVSPGQASDVDLQGLTEAGESVVDPEAAEVFNGHAPSKDDRDELHVARHVVGLFLAHQTDRGTVEKEGLMIDGDLAVRGGEVLGVHMSPREEGTMVTWSPGSSTLIASAMAAAVDMNEGGLSM
jgi:hypothetical protein